MTQTGLQCQRYHLVTAGSGSALIFRVAQSAAQVHGSQVSPEMKGAELSEWCERGAHITKRTHPGKLSLRLELSGGPRSSEGICPDHQEA